MGVAVRLCALALAAQSSDRVTTLRAILTASIGLMSLACVAGAMAASMLTTAVTTATAWLRHTASLSIRAISFIYVVIFCLLSTSIYPSSIPTHSSNLSKVVSTNV